MEAGFPKRSCSTKMPALQHARNAQPLDLLQQRRDVLVAGTGRWSISIGIG
jgi:hypothetical protein